MKALASRKRSCPISVRSFFFCLRGLLAQAGDLVGYGNERLSQFFKALIVGDQWFDLLGLLGGNAFRELLALDVALEDKIRSLLGSGTGPGLFKELAAQRAAAKAVDGLDLVQDLFPALFELQKRSRHGRIVSLQIQYASKKARVKLLLLLLFKSSDYFVLHPPLATTPIQ